MTLEKSNAVDPLSNDSSPANIHELLAEAERERQGHVDPRTYRFLDESTEKRIRRVDAEIFISYPELAVLLNEAKWLVLGSRRSRARGIYIGGENGCGKTSIANVLQREYPVAPRPMLGIDHPRVLSISLSGARTTKAMLSRILDAAKVPHVSSQTIHHHERVVLETLRAMKCALLITDETQDILLGHPKEQIRVIEVMKLLMNELGIPILALGTPNGKDAFRADPHMAARFETYLLPSWEVGEKLGAFLATFEKSIPLQRPSNLSRKEIQKILINKSGGCLDAILKRIRLAAKHAIVEGIECITKDLLEADLMHPSVSLLCSSTGGKS